jgi:cytochrome c-type biogenesis protein CcmH
MPPGTVDWLPGLVVLAGGLIGGFFLVRRLVGSPAAVTPPGGESIDRRDLMARRDVLIDQLRELHGAAEAADERRRLEREAAHVLRDIDRLDATLAPRRATRAAPTAAAEAPARHDRAALKGFLWGTGSAAAIALLLFLVSRSATDREAGGSLTGAVPGGAMAGDAQTAQLQQAVQKNPDDLDARMALARHALAQQDMMTVYDQTRAILEKEPGHARALSYQALVRLAMGQADAAERMLGDALKNDPDLLEGYIHLSLVHLRQGRLDAAEKDIDDAAKRHPAQAPRLRALWSEMRAQAESTPEGGGAPGEDPHEGLPEPGARAAAPAGGGIAGTVELDGVTPPPGAIVFVTVRPAGTTGGPPIAAKRLPATSFPLAFQVGPGDSMMGQALPERMRVEARVDSDGDPLTRDPADPAASADDVRVGATGVRLVLRRAR